MEFNADELRLRKTPPQELKMRFLKIDMIRIAVIKKYKNKEVYYMVLQNSITHNRRTING
jgi:hypothetical protein